MSGGSFDYQQFHISNIADSIENELRLQGTEKDKRELYCSEEYYEKFPEEKLYYTYPVEIQEKFKEAVLALRKAAVYAQRVDWFLSGDDGEESFIKRLAEDLAELS